MKNNQFGSTVEAFAYPALLLVVLWTVFWADHLFPLIDFYKFGVLPQELKGWKGVFFMPLIHSKDQIEHIINNSFPTAILLGAIVYYYRSIALRMFIFSWLFTGLGVWIFAENSNSYHIGISGIVYAMAAFLFTSGVIRKHRPLQAISLFVTFVYGSLIWGVFPVEMHVSWEGHLMGLLSGVGLAFFYRKLGPQPPKYLYEIEKEMGIEPPDLEGQWNEKLLREQEKAIAFNNALQQESDTEAMKVQNEVINVKWHYIEKQKNDGTKDDKSQ